MHVGKLAEYILRHLLRLARRSPRIDYLLDQDAIEHISFDPSLYEKWKWPDIDRMYTFCRRRLNSDPLWRLGPNRVRGVAREAFEALSPYLSLTGKMYCDLGCGAFHPYGVSTVMFLNGAESTVALDIRSRDDTRAAEAIADLLCEVIAAPEEWIWGENAPDALGSRIRQFDLPALKRGELEKGLRNVPLRHVVADVHANALAPDSIDVMTSKSVLEHFLDFGGAMQRLFHYMSHGGIAAHTIDLRDHRAHGNKQFHWWSFLAESPDWTDGNCNRLRSAEIRSLIEKAGFDILRYDTEMGNMPPGFMQEVKGRFRDMSEAELRITKVACVIRKP